MAAILLRGGGCCRRGVVAVAQRVGTVARGSAGPCSSSGVAVGVAGFGVVGASSSSSSSSSSSCFTHGRVRHAASTVECREMPKEHKRRPVSGTSGVCDSGVRFYAARSKKADESASCFAVMENYHQFAVYDGLSGFGDSQDNGSHCAKFCAQRLTRLTAQAFVEQPSFRGATGPDGNLVTEEEAATTAWCEALTAGFANSDRWCAQEKVAGACGALVCVVARSGVYAASIGLGRIVIGTEDDGGKTVHCDEASSPHTSDSTFEVERLGKEGQQSLDRLPATRILGGHVSKSEEPLLIPLPDIVRNTHSEGRRYVILGSEALWAHGPRAPVEWAVEAYLKGKSPADALIERTSGDVVAMVLVLPGGLGCEDSPLPPHDVLVWPFGQS